MEETTVGAAEAEALAAETEESVDPTEGRAERLEKLAKNHILASMGVGLIPFPLVDMVALFGIQLDLVKKLSVEYDVPFKQEIGKSIVSSLVGGFLPASLGSAIARFIKFIPIIGQSVGAVTMPVFSGLPPTPFTRCSYSTLSQAGLSSIWTLKRLKPIFRSSLPGARKL